MIVLKNHAHYQTFKASPIKKCTYSDVQIVQKPTPNPKIYPIRVLHQKLTKAIDIQMKLQVKAYKHVKKVAATGPNTVESLHCIQQAKNIKTLRSFEFDPYLCDTSCLSDLIMTYPRLKKIKELKLVIKRMDKQDLATKSRLMFKKFNRLTKFTSELAFNADLYTASPMFFFKDTSKSYSLKSLTFFVVDIPVNGSSDAASKAFTDFRKNLIRLEEFSITKLKSSTDINKIELSTDSYRIPPVRFFLKKYNFCIGIMPGWISVSENSQPSLFYLDCIRTNPLIEDLSLKFLRYTSVLEFIEAINQLLPTKQNLKKLKLTFSKCQIGDNEILELCQNIKEIPNLKQFTLEILQYPNVSPDCIRYFAKTLASHPTVEVFDIYTRRLDIPEPQIEECVKAIKRIPDVQCVNFKQSLHTFKRKQIQLL